MRLLICPREMLRDQRRYAIISIAQEAGQGNAAGPDSHRHSPDGGNPRPPYRHSREGGIHGHPYRHSREGGNPRPPISSFPRRRESTATHIVIPAKAGIHGHPYRHSAKAGIHARGTLRWVPVYTGTTAAGGAPHTVGGGAPTSSFPRRRESTPGGTLRWVPVYTGTTVAGGAPHTVGGSAPISSFPRRRESTATHIVIPAKAGSTGGGRLRWVPVYTGTTVGDGAPHTVGGGAPTIVIPRVGGNPRRGDTAMGSRLHGNDGGRRRTPHGRRRRTHIVIPATVGGGAPHTVGGGAPHMSFPRRRESTAGETAMGSRLHGNDGGRRRGRAGRPDVRRRAPNLRRRHRIECWAGALSVRP